jgi:O-antigen/teichoic acid export membrane protein
MFQYLENAIFKPMNQKKLGPVSYLYQLTSSLGVGIISFALSLFIAKQIGASHFGQYSTALAIGSILAIGLDGGLRSLLTRERTRESEHLATLHKELPHIAMGYSLVTAILASVICWTVFPRQIYLGLGIIWCFWGVVITQYASAMLRGDGHLKTDSQWQLKQRAFTALLIIITIWLGYSEAWQLLFAWAVGALCANLFFKEGFRFNPNFKPLLSLGLYRTLLPLLWIDLATTIYFRSDLIMLRSFKVPDGDIGQYAAAYRLIEAAILVSSPISVIIFRKVRLLNEGRLLQTSYIIKLLLISVLFGLIGLALIELTAIPLVQLTYGAQYTHAATLLPILGWMIVVLIPNTILTQVALALNLEKSYAITATLAAIGNLILNFLFIPKYGTIATAYTSIATELILMIGLLFSIFTTRKSATPCLES